MSMPKGDDLHTNSEVISDIFDQLLESIIVDVASESHRIAKLGLDSNLDQVEEELRLSAEARAKASDPSHVSEPNGKYIADIFGQSHPASADEIFDCMNCGRSVMAGKFAPHLEKCMGKGRRARVKSTRAAQNKNSDPLSKNGGSASAGHELSDGTFKDK